ncbi:Terminal uridylyltransferase 4 [Mactra antiquata]
MDEKSEEKFDLKMEDELKKMLAKTPSLVKTEMKNAHEIEADLKRMLNMGPSTSHPAEAGTERLHESKQDLYQKDAGPGPSNVQNTPKVTTAASIPQGVVVTMDDLESLTASKPYQPEPSNNRKNTKNINPKKKKKGKHPDEERPGEHRHHGQHEDPPVNHNVDTGDVSQVAVPKKKKKKKNKPPKKKDKDNSMTGDDDKADDDIDDSESEDSEEKVVTPTKVLDQRILDFYKTKYLDNKLTPEILIELEEERIFPLKKKSSPFPNARYFCRLCDYHCDNIPVCKQHAEDARHRRRKEIMLQDKMLKNLPTPSQSHIAAIDSLIEEIWTLHGLTDEELSNRLQVSNIIQSTLNKALPDISLEPFGSSVTGFGLKDADLNMNLMVPQGENSARHLVQVFKILSENPDYKDVRSEFQSAVPAVLFTSPCGTLQCQIAIGCELSCYTSQYLAIYSKLDDRLRKLAVAFRYWAKICQLDEPEAGSLPAYSYGLMTVYFLQQIKHPILPVFWKDLSEEALKRPQSTNDILNLLSKFKELTWKTQNTDSVGSLWKDLLMFYGLNFNINDHVVCVRYKKLVFRSEKKWKSKRIAIEDPFISKRNVARSLQNLAMFDYFYNCLRKGGLYFSLPTSQQDGLKYISTLSSTFKVSRKDHRKQKGKQVTGLPQSLVVTNKKVNDSSNSLACDKSTLGPAEPVSANQSNNHENLMKVSNEVPVEQKPVLDKQLAKADGTNQNTSEVIDSEDKYKFAMDFVDKVISDAVDIVKNKTIHNSELVENGAKTKHTVDSIEVNGLVTNEGEIEDDTKADKNEESVVHNESSAVSENELNNNDSILSSEDKEDADCSVNVEYDYKFDSKTLTDGKGPSIICCVCDKEGHLKANCPEDELPVVVELPQAPKTHIMMLTQVIKQVPKDFKLSQRELMERENIRKDLELHIQTMYPGAQLQLFGSSMNGFGFHQSDLDICVTLIGRNPEDVNFVEHIEAICKKLKGHRGLYGVFPITTAKVPIVKFVHRQTQLEGDISMYNVLALQNTKLLYTYACIDPRVQTLGYAIKVFAKVCDIGDASKGSLSSYAYMLMMIHYLQHTNPPVIPVLQELRYSDQPNPEYMVEGWNTWFFGNIDDLPHVWSRCGKNNQSVGELWLGFFRYYLEEFSFLEQVVSIRQYQPLVKFEKLWNGKCIAIEDPFDHDHNLGGALSRKMNQYIQRTFANARVLYATPFLHLPPGFVKLEDYFFDKGQLVDGEPPSDRLCRVCSKIGHIAKECPILIAKKEREAAERRRREEMKKQEGASPNRNSGPRHHNDRNIERQGTPRSLSDPSSEDSLTGGSNRQKVYQRQHSQPNTLDKRQIPGLMDLRFQDGYNQANYGSPRASHSDNQPPYSPNRRSQNHQPPPRSPQSKTPTNYSHRQQQQQVFSNQQYHYNNRNENSRSLYNQGQAATRNGPQSNTNQTFDLRQQHRNYTHQGDSYTNSQSHVQPPPGFKKLASQVYTEPYMFGGPYQRYFHTNPSFNYPFNVTPSIPLFMNNNMAAAGQVFPVPVAPMMNLPTGIVHEIQRNNQPFVCMPNFYIAPSQEWVEPVNSKQIVRQNCSIESDVHTNQEYLVKDTVDPFDDHMEPSNSPGRVINVQKSGKIQGVHDFGITVKNEYYENKEK